ncbi:MAG: S1C family serine protease [Verrucomicrobia bacterium]|nr:S1C family serine protease [Verrucomicrobiota bacterium]
MSRLSASKLLALVAFCGALSVASPVFAGPVAESLSSEVREVFERCKGAVVKIEATDKTGQLCGTGFFIDPNGTLLTSYSVGGDSRDFVVITPNNVRTTAHLLIADARAGIAMLKAENVPCGTPFLSLAKPGELAVATPVVAVAYPMDMPLTPSFGMISGFDLKYLGRYFATTHIRASVPVQRGQGGAPLLNMQGEVLGVVISSIDNGSACFAIPAEAVKKVHRDYERYGAVRPGWLGVVVRAATNCANGSTAEVERLEPDAPAIKAGLLPGDILLKIGEIPIKSPQDVLNASFFLTAGENIPVIVWRSNKELTFQTEPADRATCEYRIPGLQAIPTASAINGDITLRLR